MWKKNLVGLVLLVAAFGVIVNALPLRTAFLFGDDEGFEVIKPLLCNQGYALYTDIWNDQPPIFTILLSAAFKAFGTSILTARCVAVLFGLILLIAFYELVRFCAGARAAVISSFLLFASPTVLFLSVSAMLELPAFATGLVSLWLVQIWNRQPHWVWLILSGAAMALALQTKLTAALVGPTVFVNLCVSSYSQQTSNRFRSSFFKITIWALSLAVTFTLIGMTWARGSLKTSWKSHTKAQTVANLQDPRDQTFKPKLILDHLESIIAAGFAIALAIRQKKLRELLLPMSLLMTAIVIHAFHRPWWNYYYIHFAIPIAWLAGWGVNALLHEIFRLCSDRGRQLISATGLKTAGLCLLVALPIARSERRLESNFKELKSRPNLETNPIVSKMREYASQTRWVYSESGIYSFHANLLVPPNLAIIMPKRFWSGQITTSDILETCKRYEPEMVILPNESRTDQWEVFLQSYLELTNDNKCSLFLSQRLQADSK